MRNCDVSCTVSKWERRISRAIVYAAGLAFIATRLWPQ